MRGAILETELCFFVAVLFLFSGLILEISVADKMSILLLNICHAAFRSHQLPALRSKATSVISPFLI